MFEFAYMRKALLVGCLLGLVLPLIGVVLVNRRTPVLGDALSHVSLAGVIGGLLLGINPLVGAMVFSLLAALSIDRIRERFPSFGEMGTAIVLSAGVGLASLLSGFRMKGPSYESFLFGSIVSVSDFELIWVIGIALLVLGLFLRYYRSLLYLSVDPDSAGVAGVPRRRVDLLFTVMTALVISIASRTVGVLLISSLMILPVSCAMLVCRSYRSTVLTSSLLGAGFTLVGLAIAFYGGLKPGGAIVLLAVFTFVSLFVFRQARTK